MKTYFEENSEVVYLGAGSLFAFLMAFLRSAKYTKKHFRTRATEGVMCAMLGSAITMGITEYWNLSNFWAMPIGIFIGFLGTDFIHAVIIGLVEYYSLKVKEKNK